MTFVIHKRMKDALTIKLNKLFHKDADFGMRLGAPPFHHYLGKNENYFVVGVFRRLGMSVVVSCTTSAAVSFKVHKLVKMNAL